MSLYYIQTNVICLTVLLVVIIAIRNKKGSLPAQRLTFMQLVAITALICVSDLIAWAAQGWNFSGARAVVYISNIVYDAAITWCGYVWLHYVDLRVRSLEYDYRRRMRITAIPLIVMVLLLVTDPFTGILFTVNEQNTYSRSAGIFLHWLISWGYLFYATFEVVRKMRRTDSRAERAQLTPMLWFIIPPAIAAVLQMFFYGLTSTQCGMTVAVLIIAVNFLVDEVSKDSLTGLNNRRALENYVIEQLQRADSELTVLMCDIDRFKSINDTYGHSVGDLVLKRMAGVMKNVCSGGTRSLFLCRYGGDEFVICGFNLPAENVELLKSDIDRELAGMQRDYSGEIGFGISIGHATGTCTTYDDVEALIRLADAMMYQNKKAKGASTR